MSLNLTMVEHAIEREEHHKNGEDDHGLKDERHHKEEDGEEHWEVDILGQALAEEYEDKCAKHQSRSMPYTKKSVP